MWTSSLRREPVAIHRHVFVSPGAGSRYLRRACTLKSTGGGANVGLSLSALARAKASQPAARTRRACRHGPGYPDPVRAESELQRGLRRLAQRTGMARGLRVQCPLARIDRRGGQWPRRHDRSEWNITLADHSPALISGAGRPRLIPRPNCRTDPDLTWRKPMVTSMKAGARPGVARLDVGGVGLAEHLARPAAAASCWTLVQRPSLLGYCGAFWSDVSEWLLGAGLATGAFAAGDG